MIDITTVLEGRAEVVVAAEITFYDPATETTEVRYYATLGFTTLSSDTVAAGRHYAERLRFPRLTWSRGSGTTSSPVTYTRSSTGQGTSRHR